MNKNSKTAIKSVSLFYMNYYQVTFSLRELCFLFIFIQNNLDLQVLIRINITLIFSIIQLIFFIAGCIIQNKIYLFFHIIVILFFN